MWVNASLVLSATALVTGLDRQETPISLWREGCHLVTHLPRTRGCWYLSSIASSLFTPMSSPSDPAKTVFHWQALVPPPLHTQVALCSTGAGGKGPGTQGGRGGWRSKLCVKVTAHSPHSSVSPRPLCWDFPVGPSCRTGWSKTGLHIAKNPVSTGSEHQEKHSLYSRSGQASSGDHVTHSRCLDPGIWNPAHCAQPLELCLLSCEMQCNTRSQVLDGENHSAHFMEQLSGPEQEEKHIYLPHLLSQGCLCHSIFTSDNSF